MKKHRQPSRYGLSTSRYGLKTVRILLLASLLFTGHAACEPDSVGGPVIFDNRTPLTLKVHRGRMLRDALGPRGSFVLDEHFSARDSLLPPHSGAIIGEVESIRSKMEGFFYCEILETGAVFDVHFKVSPYGRDTSWIRLLNHHSGQRTSLPLAASLTRNCGLPHPARQAPDAARVHPLMHAVDDACFFTFSMSDQAAACLLNPEAPDCAPASTASSSTHQQHGEL